MMSTNKSGGVIRSCRHEDLSIASLKVSARSTKTDV